MTTPAEHMAPLESSLGRVVGEVDGLAADRSKPAAADNQVGGCMGVDHDAISDANSRPCHNTGNVDGVMGMGVPVRSHPESRRCVAAVYNLVARNLRKLIGYFHRVLCGASSVVPAVEGRSDDRHGSEECRGALAGSTDIVSTAVLPNGEGTSLKGEGVAVGAPAGTGGRATGRAAKEPTGRQRRRPVVPTTKIEADYNVRYKYSSFDRSTDVEVRIESDEPIKAYILSRDDLKDFDDGGDFDYFVRGTVDGERTLRCRIPVNTRWALLMVNRGTETAAVHWEFIA